MQASTKTGGALGLCSVTRLCMANLAMVLINTNAEAAKSYVRFA